MLVLDGSYGEGGGQILRSALSLAALTGQRFCLEHIRAGRPQPGLRPQHLTAVRAVAQITRAELSGAEIGATRLTFSPRGVYPGQYLFDVAEKTGSAGSVCLIAQTILPVLAFASQPTTVILRGGTHVPWSPPAHYLSQVFLPLVAAMGLRAELALKRWGFYPVGGGEMELQIRPLAAPLQGGRWLTAPRKEDFRALSATANLPAAINERQARTLLELLPFLSQVEQLQAPSPGRGTFVWLWAPQAGFSALGAKGKPAEQVATEAAADLQRFLASGAAVDRHLADQLVLYAALAAGETRFTTEAVTQHLLTNIWVIEQFLPVKFSLTGALNAPGEVAVTGLGWQPSQK